MHPQNENVPPADMSFIPQLHVPSVRRMQIFAAMADEQLFLMATSRLFGGPQSEPFFALTTDRHALMSVQPVLLAEHVPPDLHV